MITIDSFTIEVVKQDNDSEFSFEDLEMFHKECYGGKIKQLKTQDRWTLSCARCSISISVDLEEGRDIIRTAVDGEQRTTKTAYPGYYPQVDVLQKTQ